MLAIYLPVFAVGIFWPSFDRDSGGPQPWALITAVSIAAITYTATAAGLLITYRQWRRGAWR